MARDEWRTDVRNRPFWAGWGLLGLSLTCLTGCQGAILGKWRLAEAVPNRHTFSIDHVAFNRDGTYSATVTIEGSTTQDTGTYDFDGFKLRLRPKAGGQRAYSVTLSPGQMTLLSMSDTSRKVVLKHAGGT